MTDDNDTPPSSVLDMRKYVKNSKGALAADDANETADSYKEARARSREALMLDVRFRDGTIESFSYATLKKAKFLPEGKFILHFDTDEISAEGNNLHKTYTAITEHRAKFIQEGTDAEGQLKPDDAPHIEKIVKRENINA